MGTHETIRGMNAEHTKTSRWWSDLQVTYNRLTGVFLVSRRDRRASHVSIAESITLHSVEDAAYVVAYWLRYYVDSDTFLAGTHVTALFATVGVTDEMLVEAIDAGWDGMHDADHWRFGAVDSIAAVRAALIDTRKG